MDIYGMQVDLVLPFQHASQWYELQPSVPPHNHLLGIGEKGSFPKRVLMEVILIFTERLKYLRNSNSKHRKDNDLRTFWMA